MPIKRSEIGSDHVRKKVDKVEKAKRREKQFEGKTRAKKKERERDPLISALNLAATET